MALVLSLAYLFKWSEKNCKDKKKRDVIDEDNLSWAKSLFDEKDNVNERK